MECFLIINWIQDKIIFYHIKIFSMLLSYNSMENNIHRHQYTKFTGVPYIDRFGFSCNANTNYVPQPDNNSYRTIIQVNTPNNYQLPSRSQLLSQSQSHIPIQRIGHLNFNTINTNRNIH